MKNGHLYPEKPDLTRRTGPSPVEPSRDILEKHRTTMSPIGSMYAIYGNMYHQYTPSVSIYIPYMDPMGLDMTHNLRESNNSMLATENPP